MKYFKLSITIISILAILFLTSVIGITTAKNETFPTTDMSLLLQKWKLSHYEVFYTDYEPEQNEKNDYIHFKADNTFTSVSEGKFEKGNFKVISKSIVLTNDREEGELRLIIEELTKEKLEVKIDDPGDPDTTYLIIHFKAAK